MTPRRILNWIVAVVCMLAFAVPMLIIAILIKMTSNGPVLYIQERVGYKQKIFRIYKFRTLAHNSANDNQEWVQLSDPRVTSVGRFLRKTRLDELPQFANVILGHMNVVGPRPEQPRIVENLKEKLEGYEQRYEVLPGITGLAQIKLPYDKTISDVRRKLAIDQEYVQTQSVLNDLRIMFNTPKIMFYIGVQQ